MTDSKAKVNIHEGKVKSNVPPPQFPVMRSLVTSSKFKNIADLLEDCLSVDKLLDYLKYEIGDEIVPVNKYEKEFKDNFINGYAFRNFSYRHFKDLGMDSLNMGQRLTLLAATRKVKRAVQFKVRKDIIMEGNCSITPSVKKMAVNNFTGICAPQREKAKYIMTSSYIKFIYETVDSEVTQSEPSGFLCFKTRTYTTSVSSSLYCDHVDISLIDDVDIKQNNIKGEVQQPSCCCITGSTDTEYFNDSIVLLSLKVKPTEGMSLGGINSKESTVVQLFFDVADEAEAFQKQVQDMINDGIYMGNRRATIKNQ